MGTIKQLFIYANGTLRVDCIVLRNRQTYLESEIPKLDIQDINKIPAKCVTVLQHRFELVASDLNGYDVYREV